MPVGVKSADLGSHARLRIGVVGVGVMGSNHARVLADMAGVTLVGVADPDRKQREMVAGALGCAAFPHVEDLLAEGVDALTIAAPTHLHLELAVACIKHGAHVLVEKPIAPSVAEGRAIIAAARHAGVSLMVGHVERFNPAVIAVEPIVNRPLFFEVHRLGVFTPRSLDVEVIYDLMIHDLDILLALVKEPVTEVKAVGIPVLTDKVDIAHARLEFAGGAVANVTSSRVSTERVRKMRFFQQH